MQWVQTEASEGFPAISTPYLSAFYSKGVEGGQVMFSHLCKEEEGKGTQ